MQRLTLPRRVVITEQDVVDAHKAMQLVKSNISDGTREQVRCPSLRVGLLEDELRKQSDLIKGEEMDRPTFAVMASTKAPP